MAANRESVLEATGSFVRQWPTESIALAVAALVTAFLCRNLVGSVPLLVWLLVVIAAASVRAVAVSRIRPTSRKSAAPAAANRTLLTGAVVIGLAFGGLAVVAMHKAQTEQASIIALWLAVISICAVPIFNGAREPVWSFALPATLLPTLTLFIRGGGEALTVGVIMLVALALVFFTSTTLFRANSRLLNLEDEAQQLRGQVEARRGEYERINQTMRTDINRRQQAENEAREAANELALMRSKAHALSETLSRVSPLCPVTGIANRRTFEEHLDAEWRRQLRAKRPLSLMMCGIDEFAHYTETYGAQASDALLHRVAKLASAVGRRPGDLAARYDGNIIAILLPDCDSRNAVRMGDALRKRIEAQKIPHEKTNIGQTMTAHIGVATLIPVKEYQPAELIQRLDKALYEARFQGGNCVVAFRTMDKLKLEHWNPKSDDMLSKQAMLHKLIIRGFKTDSVGYPPSSVLPDKTAEGESVCALYQGELKLIIEGESLLLRAGDVIYIPTGTTWGAEVVSPRDVLGFEGRRGA
ncbi:MAG: diguanylate cyclase [Gammaproteobacteria bacterium]